MHTDCKLSLHLTFRRAVALHALTHVGVGVFHLLLIYYLLLLFFQLLYCFPSTLLYQSSLNTSALRFSWVHFEKQTSNNLFYIYFMLWIEIDLKKSRWNASKYVYIVLLHLHMYYARNAAEMLIEPNRKNPEKIRAIYQLQFLWFFLLFYCVFLH